MTKVILILSVLMITGCGIKTSGSVCAPNDLREAIYVLKDQQSRQSVKISIAGKDFTFQGVIAADKEKNSIRIIAITGFGIKLFEMEFNGNDKINSYISEALNNIPYFKTESERAIRRLYINPFCGIKVKTEQSELYIEKKWLAEIFGLENGKYKIDYTSFKPYFRISVIDIE